MDEEDDDDDDDDSKDSDKGEDDVDLEELARKEKQNIFNTKVREPLAKSEAAD